MFILGDITLLVWAKRQKNKYDTERKRYNDVEHYSNTETLKNLLSFWTGRLDEVN